MARTKQTSIFTSIALLLTGALVGGIWAFLKTWMGAINYFALIGPRAIVIGILFGWLPALAGAVAGFLFGAFEGGKLSSLDQIDTILKHIAKNVKFAEGQASGKKWGFDHSTLAMPVSPLKPIYRPVKRKAALRHSSVRH